LARYRLRFVLQELDLPAGVTTIGRSFECQLTIDDPLVSRKHARITVDANGACVEDLGSRNGVKINGVAIRGPSILCSGDRLRIGTQELIFTSVDHEGRAESRATGQLRLCAKCRLPYAREMVSCPACEATEQTEEDTPTATGHGDAGDWTVRLLVEGLDRALRLGRVVEADGLVRRAAARVDEIVQNGGQVTGEVLGALAIHASSTSQAAHDPSWVVWVIDAYGRIGLVPPPTVVTKLTEAAAIFPRPIRNAVHELLARLELLGPAASSIESEALLALRAIHAAGRDVADDLTR